MDAAGNVYTTGRFKNTVDFDPGAGTANITTAGSSYEAYISKLDSNGDFVWAEVFDSGANNSYAEDLALDSSGNLIVVGVFDGQLDADPGAGTVNLPSGGNDDGYVIQLDSDGVYRWGASIAGISGDAVYGVDTDAADNVYLTGLFKNTVDFDPGASAAEMTTSRRKDVFVTKWDSAGAYLWAKRGGSDDHDFGNGIAFGDDGTAVTGGQFEGWDAADFDDVQQLPGSAERAFTWALAGNGLDAQIEQAGGQADSTGDTTVNFTVTFSDTVTDFATGDVTLGGSTGANSAVVTGAGTTYNVAVSGMTANGPLSVYLAPGVATDAAGMPSLVSFSDDNVVEITGLPPLVTTYTPADDANDVDRSADLVLDFSADMAKGTGFITIYDASDDSIVEEIDVNSGQVTISGSTVTINPTDPLTLDESYYGSSHKKCPIVPNARNVLNPWKHRISRSSRDLQSLLVPRQSGPFFSERAIRPDRRHGPGRHHRQRLRRHRRQDHLELHHGRHDGPHDQLHHAGRRRHRCRPDGRPVDHVQ